mmetsp:Transcript_57428/g.154194  ORF Transcript_57428/g.154194 Transcript_57428/m.154194 type:complete len:207 (-) Transcript_57428:511-1131(-)
MEMQGDWGARRPRLGGLCQALAPLPLHLLRRASCDCCSWCLRRSSDDEVDVRFPGLAAERARPQPDGSGGGGLRLARRDFGQDLRARAAAGRPLQHRGRLEGHVRLRALRRCRARGLERQLDGSQHHILPVSETGSADPMPIPTRPHGLRPDQCARRVALEFADARDRQCLLELAQWQLAQASRSSCAPAVAERVALRRIRARERG